MTRVFDGSLDQFFWSDRGLRVGDQLTITLYTPERLSIIEVYTGHPPAPGHEKGLSFCVKRLLR